MSSTIISWKALLSAANRLVESAFTVWYSRRREQWRGAGPADWMPSRREGISWGQSRGTSNLRARGTEG